MAARDRVRLRQLRLCPRGCHFNDVSLPWGTICCLFVGVAEFFVALTRALPSFQAQGRLQFAHVVSVGVHASFSSLLPVKYFIEHTEVLRLSLMPSLLLLWPRCITGRHASEFRCVAL